jgi:thioredoxin-related protein
VKTTRLYIIVAAFFSFIACPAQVKQDAEEAFRVSSEAHKPVLIVFAGSDWCAPCVRFEKKILTENTFLDFAKENLVVLKADFPQRNKLTPELQHQNEALAEKYNPKGIFPYLVLLNLDRSVLSTILYNNQSPVEFISELKSHILK